MAIQISISGESERYWKQDAFKIRLNGFAREEDVKPFVAISYKRASKGGGVLDHRVEIQPEDFRQIIRAMAAADREALIAAYRSELVAAVQSEGLL